VIGSLTKTNRQNRTFHRPEIRKFNRCPSRLHFTGASFQSQGAQSQVSGHHHHHHAGGSDPNNASSSSSSTTSSDTSSTTASPAQLFTELGQALQSSNLSAAQQAYSSLQQDFQQLAPASSASNSSSAITGTTGISVNA